MHNARKLIRSYFFLTLMFLSGCAGISGYPKLTYDEKAEMEAVAELHRPSKIIEYENAKTDSAKKLIRDNFVYARMLSIDIEFTRFVRKLHKENIVGKVGVSWAKTGVSTAGGLIAGYPSQILSGVAAGLEASKAPVDEHVFYQKTIAVIFGQMEASRKEVKARILTGLVTKPLSDYPLPRALMDLDDYYRAGTIPGALNNIAAASGNANQRANRAINKTLGITIDDNPSAK